MIGIKDIAKVAGVSISTVSNVMNNKSNVSSETRSKILQICNEMSYFPNAVGRSLKSGKSKTILFNFSDFDRNFYLKVIKGINDFANNNEYDLIICTEKSCEKYMRSNITSGCICLDEKMQNEVLLRSANVNYPIVVLDRIIENPYIKSIVVNNYESMAKLVEGLVARGFTKYGFIGGPEHTDDNQERYRAFVDVLERNNIAFHSKNYFSGDFREKSGYKIAKLFMLVDELPEIIVCANDNMAIGVIKAVREKGLRVPEDISVVGFDDCDLASAYGLTTVTVPNYERGYLAARYLIENINGKNNVDPIKIMAEVKWRKSVLLK